MLRLGCLLFVVSLAWLAACQPIDSEDGWIRIQRGPLNGRMMIVRNYLLRQPGSPYDHQASMSAFAASTLGGGAYYGGPQKRPANRLVDEQSDEEEEKTEDKPEEKQEDEEAEDDYGMEEAEEEKKPKAPRVAPKAPKIPKRRVAAEDDDDEDEEDIAPRGKGRKNEDTPTYSNFFPIVFSRTAGVSRRRSSTGRGDEGEDEGSNPGLIAISNSFSNGRGAIASSTSTAYGGSAPVATPSQQYRKSSPSRYRSS